MRVAFLVATFFISHLSDSSLESTNCKIQFIKLHYESTIRCFYSGREKAILLVAFDFSPKTYTIQERYKQDTNESISSELFLYFTPSVVHNNTKLTLFVVSTNLIQEATLCFDFLDRPRFVCTEPEEKYGSVVFNCTGTNTRKNRYELDYAYYGNEKPVYSVRTVRTSELEEFSFFIIEKSWLLTEMTINIKFYSEFFSTVKRLAIVVPKISLPMRVYFKFVDSMTNEDSSFTCNNLKNGIIPICESDYFESEDYIIEIYDPKDRKFTSLSIITLNNFKSIIFGKWKCVVTNKNGRVQLYYDFNITDKPCLVNTEISESYSIFSLSNGLVYRITNTYDFNINCVTLSVPAVTEYLLYEMGSDREMKGQSETFNIQYIDQSASSYWSCAVRNDIGETQSVSIIIFYEPYFVHRANPTLFMVCMLPIITMLTLCSVYITVLIYHEKNPED